MRGFRIGFDRSDWVAALLVLLAAILVVTPVLQMPVAAGQLEDDGVYLLTGKALSEGAGYRHLQLPGEPYQTKYPILYPFALSLVWRLFPEFPSNLVYAQLLNALFGAAAAWLGYRLARRVWGAPAAVATCGALLAVVNPWSARMVQLTMAEQLFSLLSLAAVYLAAVAPGHRPGAEQPAPGYGYAALTGLLAGGAYLTRSIGVCVILAVVVAWLTRRQIGRALCSLVAAGLVAAGWQAWKIWASAQNDSSLAASALRYDLDYSSWLSADIASILRVMAHNLVAMGLSLFSMLAQPAQGWIGGQIGGGRPSPLLTSGILLAAVLFAVGLLTRGRGARAATHTYFVASFGLIAFWPFDTQRFFMPLLPLLMPAALLGLLAVCAFLFRRVSARTDSPGDSRVKLAGRLVVVLAAALLWHHGRLVFDFTGAPYLASQQAARSEFAELILQRTPPSAVIAGPNGAYFHLVTGRRVVPAVPNDDPVAFYYPEDRQILQFGRKPSKGQAFQFAKLLMERTLPYYRAVGAGYVVTFDARRGQGAVFDKFLRANAALFRPVGQAGPYQMHSIAP